MLLAVVKGSQGRARLSEKVLQKAILHFYSSQKLFPSGVVAELPSVQEWSLKNGKALKRLAPQKVQQFFFVLVLDWK